jgi:hypothetical protein
MAMKITLDPTTMMRRRLLAEALTGAGYPTAEATLATKATRGGGPPFQLYGRIPLYSWGASLQWAQSRLSRVMCSTSELDVAKPRIKRASDIGDGDTAAAEMQRQALRADQDAHIDAPEPVVPEERQSFQGSPSAGHGGSHDR